MISVEKVPPRDNESKNEERYTYHTLIFIIRIIQIC